jgi:hypothetical protein
VDVAVLGHRGMLGSVVARRWAELGANVVTSSLRYPELADWAVGADIIVNCMAGTVIPANLHGWVIQPSTDAINELTPYAEAKRAADSLASVVVRSGIVDVTRQPARAYVNWFLNPLTPLEWADLAWQMREAPGFHTDGRETLTRYDVACAVAQVFGGRKPKQAWDDQPRARVMRTHSPWRPALTTALRTYRDWIQEGGI